MRCDVAIGTITSSTSSESVISEDMVLKMKKGANKFDPPDGYLNPGFYNKYEQS